MPGDLILGRWRLPTVEEALRHQSNDYTALEEVFRRETGCELVTEELIPADVAPEVMGVSVIVPARELAPLEWTLEGLAKQELSAAEFAKLEVIVIDDGSPGGTERQVRSFGRGLLRRGAQLLYARSSANVGVARARNVGLALATGDVLVFLDADTLPEPAYLQEVSIRHRICDGMILVALHESVSPRDRRVRSGELMGSRPDLRTDTRVEDHVTPDGSNRNPVAGSSLVRPLAETANFKTLGQGRRIGPWTLPDIVFHDVSVRTRYARHVGGVAPEFGLLWGCEDNEFAARLIAAGLMVVPLLSAGTFHIGIFTMDAQRRREHQQTLAIYRDLLQRPAPLRVVGVDNF
jgi:GT2 family glycosyltransferase